MHTEQLLKQFRRHYIYRGWALFDVLTLAGVLGALLLAAMAPVGWADDMEQGQDLPADLTELSLEELMNIEIHEIRSGEMGSYALRLSEYTSDSVTVELHGYLATEFKLLYPEEEGPSTFDLHHSVVMIRAQVYDWVTAELALEWEHAGKEFYIPFAFVDTKVSDMLIVRAGYFPVPIGVFNEYQYPDFLRKTAQAPMATREIVPALWSEVGLQLRGKVDWSVGRGANYALFVVNGLKQPDPDPDDNVVPEGGEIRKMRRNYHDENDANKAVGGRLGLTPLNGLDVGVSAYTGAYTTNGRRLTILDADLTLRRARLLVRLEGAVALQDITGDTLAKRGAYVMVAYRAMSFLEPYIQLETINIDGASEATRHSVLGGALLYPFPVELDAMMVKVEWRAIRNEARDLSGLGIVQLTLAF